MITGRYCYHDHRLPDPPEEEVTFEPEAQPPYSLRCSPAPDTNSRSAHRAKGSGTAQAGKPGPGANVDKGDFVTGANGPRNASRNAQGATKHHQSMVPCANSSAIVVYT